jgi:hypothetical protein
MFTRASQRRCRSAVLAAIASLLASLLASQAAVQLATSAPAAAAIPGLHVEVAYSAIDSVGYKGLAVKCPSGQKVLGGGGEVFYADQTAVFLNDLRPIADGAAFEMAAGEMAPGYDGSWQPAGYAVCAGPLSGYTIVTGNSGPARATYKSTYTPNCPAHLKVFGAGGEVLAPNGQAGLTLVRPDGALTIGRAAARVAEGGFWDQWSVTSYAICAYPVPGQQYVDTLARNWNGTVDCPAGTKVDGIGGGGGLVDLGPYYLGKIAPYDINGNTGAAAEMTGTPNGGMIIQATCSN